MFEAIFKSGKKSQTSKHSPELLLAQLDGQQKLDGDIDREIYVGAISDLRNFSQLTKLMNHEKNWVQAAASNQLSKLLEVGSLSEEDLQQLRTSIASGVEPGLLAAIAIHSKDADLRKQACEAIALESTLVEVAAQSGFADTRQAAAHAVQSQLGLQQLFRNVGNKDKNIRKYVQEKLAEMESLEMAKARAEQLLNELISLNGQPPFSFSRYPVGQVKQWWTELPVAISESRQEQFESLLGLVESRMQEEDAAMQSDSVTIRQGTIDQLKELSAEAHDVTFCTAEYLETFQHRMDQLVSEWDQASAENLPEHLLKNLVAAYTLQQEKLMHFKNTFEKDCAEVKPCVSLLERVKSHLSESGKLKEREVKNLQLAWDQSSKQGTLVDAAMREEWTQLYHKLVDQQEIQKAKIAELMVSTEDLLAKAEVGLTEGNLTSASQFVGQIRRNQLEIGGLGGSFDKDKLHRFSELQQKIKEMRKWEKWGTNKVREALCLRVEQLTGADQKPQTIEKSIREIREEWMELNRRHGQTSEKMWARFNELCNKAFEPVKAYQKEQKSIRNANLVARTELCEKLEAYFNQVSWDNPDWKQVADDVRQIDRQWSFLGHVDFRDRKIVQKRFDDTKKQFFEPLQREAEKEVHRRQAIIQRMEKLSQEPKDVAAMLDEVKSARHAWKPRVASARDEEEKLWVAFNAACNGVETLCKEQRNQATQQRKQQQGMVQQLFDAFESLINDALSTEKELRHKWQALKEQSREALASEHRTDPKIRLKIQQLEKQVERKLKQKEKDKFWEKLLKLIGTADLCSHLESRAIQPSSSTADADLIALKNQWAAVEPLDKQWDASLATRWNRALAWVEGTAALPDERQFAKNLLEVQRLCLELEELAEVESPAEFRQARMSFRLSKLSNAMREGGSLTDKEKIDHFQKFVLSYCFRGPLLPAEVSALDRRFQLVFDAMRSSAIL